MYESTAVLFPRRGSSSRFIARLCNFTNYAFSLFESTRHPRQRIAPAPTQTPNLMNTPDADSCCDAIVFFFLRRRESSASPRPTSASDATSPPPTRRVLLRRDESSSAATSPPPQPLLRRAPPEKNSGSALAVARSVLLLSCRRALSPVRLLLAALVVLLWALGKAGVRRGPLCAALNRRRCCFQLRPCLYGFAFALFRVCCCVDLWVWIRSVQRAKRESD